MRAQLLLLTVKVANAVRRDIVREVQLQLIANPLPTRKVFIERGSNFRSKIALSCEVVVLHHSYCTDYGSCFPFRI